MGGYHANSGRMDQVLYASDATGHILPTYIPGNSEAQRLMGVGQTPPRTWVPNGQAFQSSVAISKGEWHIATPSPPASSRYVAKRRSRTSSLSAPLRARRFSGTADSAGTLPLTAVHGCFRSASIRSPRSIASSRAGRDGNGVPIPTIRSHESAFSRMPTIRPSQSARLAPVSSGIGATVEHAVDSREALQAAKNEILELRKQLGLPEDLPILHPPVAVRAHVPESPGGFTPEPGMPRTAESGGSDAVSLPGSPRAESAVVGKHYGDRSDLSTADSVASSAWSERSALIRAKFKPTQQLFEQRFATPRLVLTRGGRTRIVQPRNVTR